MVREVRCTRRYLLGLALATPGLLSMISPSRAGEAAGDPAAGLVSMDMVISEMLLSLGVVPLATANIPLYRRLVAVPAMPEGVADLGPLNEPNLEFLSMLGPSRILMADWQAAGLEGLARIAPIQTLAMLPRQTPALDHAKALLSELAGSCGRAAVAAAMITQTEAQIDQARSALLGFDRPIYLCRFNRDGRNLAVFGGNGMLSDVLRRLGLTNAYRGRVNALSGGASLPLTRLADTPDAILVHFDRGQETDAALARLAQNPLWQALPAVRGGRMLRIPVIYPTGGLRSASRFARELADGLPELADG